MHTIHILHLDVTQPVTPSYIHVHSQNVITSIVTGLF
jgi:hypothetical protein